MESLLLSLAIVDDHDADSKPALDWFEESWMAPENVGRIVGLCRRPIEGFDEMSMAERFGILHEHADVAQQVAVMLVEHARGQLLMPLGRGPLSRLDRLALHRARTAHARHDLRGCVEAAADLCEAKIRDVAYVLARAAYGEEYRLRLPNSVAICQAKNENRGPSALRRQRDENVFFDLARGQYAEVLHSPGMLPLLFPQGVSEAERLQSQQRMAHLFALANAEKHKYRDSYFREHAGRIVEGLLCVVDVCRRLNGAILGLLNSEGFVVDEKMGRYRGHFAIGQEQVPIFIEGKDYRRIARSLLGLLDRGIEILPLRHVLIIEGIRVEIQLAMLQRFISKQWVILDSRAMAVLLTEEGRRQLQAIDAQSRLPGVGNK